MSSRCSTARGSAGSGTSPTRSSRASTAAPPSPPTRRASRASGSRSIEAMACGCPRRRLVARVARRGERRRGGARGSRGSRCDRGSDRATRSRVESELVARGLEHAAAFTWRAVGEIFLRGYEEAVDVMRPMRTCSSSSSSGAAAGVPRRAPRAGAPRLLEPRRGRRRGRRDARRRGAPRARGGDRARRAPLSLRTRSSMSLGVPRRDDGLEVVTVTRSSAEAPAGWEPTLDDEHVDYRWCDADERARAARSTRSHARRCVRSRAGSRRAT